MHHFKCSCFNKNEDIQDTMLHNCLWQSYSPFQKAGINTSTELIWIEIGQGWSGDMGEP